MDTNSDIFNNEQLPYVLETDSVKKNSPALSKLRNAVNKIIEMLGRNAQNKVVKDCKLLKDASFIEFLDPLHRQGAINKPLWRLWKADFQKTISFWDYLKSQEVINPHLLKEELQIDYLTPEQREKYLTTIQVNDKGECMLLYSDGNLVQDNLYMFVLGPDRKLYIGLEKKAQTQRQFHHSSFFAGTAVLAAGELTIENGVLKMASSLSGHYKPTEKENKKFLRFLENKGVDLTTFTFEGYQSDNEAELP